MLALLCGSVPVAIGAVPHSSGAAFALDICHPVQALDRAAVQCNLPIPTNYLFAPAQSVYCAAVRTCLTLADRIAEAPDTPPPKLTV